MGRTNRCGISKVETEGLADKSTKYVHTNSVLILYILLIFAGLLRGEVWQD